jgi:membrane protease subunit (stomatin/prohibitin family)
MGELRIEIHNHASTGELTLRLHGSFDSTAAFRVHDAIKELPRPARTRVDFADIQTISDHALVRFIQLIHAAEIQSVQLLGLSTHHQKLLRYLWPDAELHPRIIDEKG